MEGPGRKEKRELAFAGNTSHSHSKKKKVSQCMLAGGVRHDTHKDVMF